MTAPHPRRRSSGAPPSPRRVSRRQMRAWLAPMRACLAEMRQGEVSEIRGYAVTRLHHRDDYARIDYCLAGFRALIARLLPGLDCAPLERLEKRLAAGVPLTVAEIDAGFACLARAEDALVGFDRATLQDAVLTEQINIEIEALGLKEAA